MQGKLDSRSEARDHALAVEWNDLRAGVREVLREKSCAGAEAVVCIWDRKLDLLDVDLERVARFGSIDVDRTVEDVSPGPWLVISL